MSLRNVAQTAAYRRFDHQIDVWIGNEFQLDAGDQKMSKSFNIRRQQVCNIAHPPLNGARLANI